MMLAQILPIVFVAVPFAAYAVYATKRRAQGQRDMAAMMATLLRETGFRVSSIVQAPLEEHVRVAAETFITFGGPKGMEWVRDCGGVSVRHFQRCEAEGNRIYYACQWYTRLERAPRVPLQIVDRRLIGVMEGVNNFMDNRSYAWERRYPQQVAIGDRELDARFLFFGHDPKAVRAAVSASGLRELLLGAKQIDLWIDQSTVTVTDPFRENFKAAAGGATGIMLSDPKTILAATIGVHERMSRIVATLARASA
jgi:hypothetical protein